MSETDAQAADDCTFCNARVRAHSYTSKNKQTSGVDFSVMWACIRNNYTDISKADLFHTSVNQWEVSGVQQM